ncbi:MAG: dTDP-4-dehydrorhamnose 3,5-epimerase [Ignavibacteriaceae bacterium]|nr:dTDP-4-dehydrorhamnose 3,5-epimerase [Ignavibacteriaceae bacterium]
MEITKANLNGILVIKPSVFEDSRGYFAETYHAARYREVGIDVDFVQDNVSVSKKNTLRGLHFQIPPKGQGKLCQVLKGSVLDVAVDIRSGSPTFGKYFSIELSDSNHLQLFIPQGFAHGFAVLSEEVIFHYKCTDFYSKQHERSIRFDDPKLGINWGVQNPIVSEKDLNAPLFKDIDMGLNY